MFRDRDARPLQEVIESALSDSEQLHLSASVPMFGLPDSWLGTRQTGESSVRRSGQQTPDKAEVRIETIELVHGDLGAGSSLRVMTSQHGANGYQPDLMTLLREEIQFIGETVADRVDLTSPAAQEAALAESSIGPIATSLNGESVSFDAISAVGVTIARAHRDGYDVILRARNWNMEGLELVAVHDVQPYIQGRRAAVIERVHTGR